MGAAHQGNLTLVSGYWGWESLALTPTAFKEPTSLWMLHPTPVGCPVGASCWRACPNTWSPFMAVVIPLPPAAHPSVVSTGRNGNHFCISRWWGNWGINTTIKRITLYSNRHTGNFVVDSTHMVSAIATHRCNDASSQTQSQCQHASYPKKVRVCCG